MSQYDITKSRIFQWLGLILIMAVFGGAYWYFKVYGSTLKVPPENGLVGYWNFDEGTGTTTADKSGNSNTGTLTNGPTWAAGKKLGAVAFDGSNDYINVTHTSSLAVTGDITVSVWVKETDRANYAGIIGKTSGAPQAGPYDFYLDQTNGRPVLYRGNGSASAGSQGTAGPTVGVWQHVAVTMSGTTVTHYLNGATNGSSTLSTAIADSGTDLRIGSRNGGGTLMKGSMDELRIYNRALSSTEIATLYAASEAKLNSSISQPQGTGRLDSGLAGYWPLDDGSGTSATDSSTNGNTMTLTSSPTWATGKIGGALTFNGSSNWAQTSDVATLNLTGSSFTFSYWAKTSSATAIITPLAIREASATDANILVASTWNHTSTGHITLNTWDYASHRITSNFASANDGNWHHVVGVYNTTSGLASLYIDGVFDNSATQTGSSGNVSKRIIIGANTVTSPLQAFPGSVDEVRVYSWALSADEVAQLYRLTTPTGVDTGLKGYWSFNAQDMSGTTAYDRSGVGNTGTLTSGPTIVEGKIGQALDFDGNDDYVTTAGISDSSYTGALTICTWAKIDTGSAYRHFVGKHASGGGSQNPFDFRTDNAATPALVLARANTNVIVWTGPQVTLGQWKYYCVVAPAALETAPVFYIDGVAAATPTQSGATTGAATGSSAAIRIGVRADDAVKMDGSLDEMRIYNRALTAAEIKSLYDAGESDKMNSSISQAQGVGRLDSSLAGYWKMDDGSGTSATDLSTNGNTGTLTNGPTWTTGQVGGAVNFDGSDDYITAGDQTALEINGNSLSVGGWFKLDTLPGSNRMFLITKGGTSAHYEYELAVNQTLSNKIRFAVFNSSTGIYMNADTTTVAPTGTWFHVLGMYDKDTTTIKIYYNGTLESSSTSTSGTIETVRTSNFLIGKRDDNAENKLDGLADEVRVYSRALSGEEVAQLYRLTSPTGVDTGLKGYWSFNGKDLSGTTAYDRSGAGNTGTLTNGPAITEGKIGQALSFDGSNDYVLATIPSSLPLTGSLSFWFKPNWSSGDSTSHVLFGAGTDATHFFRLQHWTDNSWYLGWSNGTDYRLVVSSGTMPVIRGTWYHMVLTWTNGSGQEVYLNGTSKASNGSLVSATLNSSLYIGSYELGNTFFDGALDEVRLYNRALTAAEIAALYNSSR